MENGNVLFLFKYVCVRARAPMRFGATEAADFVTSRISAAHSVIPGTFFHHFIHGSICLLSLHFFVWLFPFGGKPNVSERPGAFVPGEIWIWECLRFSWKEEDFSESTPAGP